MGMMGATLVVLVPLLEEEAEEVVVVVVEEAGPAGVHLLMAQSLRS